MQPIRTPAIPRRPMSGPRRPRRRGCTTTIGTSLSAAPLYVRLIRRSANPVTRQNRPSVDFNSSHVVPTRRNPPRVPSYSPVKTYCVGRRVEDSRNLRAFFSSGVSWSTTMGNMIGGYPAGLSLQDAGRH